MLSLNPQTPAPGASFEVRVDAYAYDIDRATIDWIINGTARDDLANSRTVTLTAPALGERTAISVSVTEPSGATHTAETAFAASAIDIIVEGQTRVPTFYAGAAAPSVGSAVRLVAMPSVYTAAGTLIAPANLIYTWRIGSTVAAAGRGKQVLETRMPRTGRMEMSVTAETSDGSARHTSFTRITPAEPTVIFYEDNPLYGIARTALPSAFTLLDEEISVRAEPYFVSRDIFNNADYAWRINNQAVANPNADPQVLTLRRTGGAGEAAVGFTIRNTTALLQAALGEFRVYFE